MKTNTKIEKCPNGRLRIRLLLLFRHRWVWAKLDEKSTLQASTDILYDPLKWNTHANETWDEDSETIGVKRLFLVVMVGLRIASEKNVQDIIRLVSKKFGIPNRTDKRTNGRRERGTRIFIVCAHLLPLVDWLGCRIALLPLIMKTYPNTCRTKLSQAFQFVYFFGVFRFLELRAIIDCVEKRFSCVSENRFAFNSLIEENRRKISQRKNCFDVIAVEFTWRIVSCASCVPFVTREKDLVKVWQQNVSRLPKEKKIKSVSLGEVDAMGERMNTSDEDWTKA